MKLIDMEYNSPKPSKKVKFGFKQISKPLPKIAKRIGVAFSAVAVYGIAQSMLIGADKYTMAFIIIGAVGAFLSSMFGTEKEA